MVGGTVRIASKLGHGDGAAGIGDRGFIDHGGGGGDRGGGGIGAEGSRLDNEPGDAAVKDRVDEIAPIQISEEVGDGEGGAVGVKGEVEVAEVGGETGGGADVGIGEEAREGEGRGAAAGGERLGGGRGAGNDGCQQGRGIDETGGGDGGGAGVGGVFRPGIEVGTYPELIGGQGIGPVQVEGGAVGGHGAERGKGSAGAGPVGDFEAGFIVGIVLPAELEGTDVRGDENDIGWGRRGRGPCGEGTEDKQQSAGQEEQSHGSKGDRMVLTKVRREVKANSSGGTQGFRERAAGRAAAGEVTRPAVIRPGARVPEDGRRAVLSD